MSLPDPRNYPPVNVRNPLIRQIMSLLTEHDVQAVDAKRTELRSQISDLLLTGDHGALNAALLQAPALEAWQTLWQFLREVVEAAPAHTGPYATLFAIPVIIVAGSSKGASLSGEINNTDSILQVLRQHGVIAADALVSIAPGLLSAETLSTISPAQLQQWKETLAESLKSNLLNPFGLETTPVFVKEESAWLRYIVGAAIQTEEAAPAIRLGGVVNTWGTALAQVLSDALKTGDATVLAIPRAPQSWLAAQETGRTLLQETRLQLLASSAIRAIRSKARTPIAVIAAHDNDEIRITLCSQEDPERWQGFVWPLTAGDRVEQISNFAQTLFQDCQVADIRVIEQIQPDRDGDLPFFVTAHFTAKQPH